MFKNILSHPQKYEDEHLIIDQECIIDPLWRESKTL